MDLCWQSNVSAFYMLSGWSWLSFQGASILISWLESPSAVILEPPKIKSVVSTVSPPIFHEVMRPECSNYCTVGLISHASKVCSKFSKPGFSNTWTMNFQMFKLVLEKAEELEIKLPTFAGSSKSKRVPEEHLFLLYWLCQSLWLCGSQSTVENSERDGNTRPPDLPLEKPTCRSGSNS